MDSKLTNSTNTLAHWRLKLSEYIFDVIHSASMNYQAPDALSRLKTTRTDQTPDQDKAQVLYITLTVLPGKREARVMYTPEYDVLIDKKGIVLPAVHAIKI